MGDLRGCVHASGEKKCGPGMDGWIMTWSVAKFGFGVTLESGDLVKVAYIFGIGLEVVQTLPVTV